MPTPTTPRSAIIPVLVRKELLPAANALSMISFGLAMTAGPLLAGILVAWVGFSDSVSAVFRTTILQAATPDHLRGRLQGAFVVVVAGGPRIGDMLAGGGTKLLSEGWVLLLGGLLCIAVAWAVARWQCGFLKYDARNPVP